MVGGLVGFDRVWMCRVLSHDAEMSVASIMFRLVWHLSDAEGHYSRLTRLGTVHNRLDSSFM